MQSLMGSTIPLYLLIGFVFIYLQFYHVFWFLMQLKQGSSETTCPWEDHKVSEGRLIARGHDIYDYKGFDRNVGASQ